jgi:hypothetical protein
MTRVAPSHAFFYEDISENVENEGAALLDAPTAFRGNWLLGLEATDIVASAGENRHISTQFLAIDLASGTC